MFIARAACAAVLMLALIAPCGSLGTIADAAMMPGAGPSLAYTVTLLDGDKAHVYTNGVVRVTSLNTKTHAKTVMMTRLPLTFNFGLDAASLPKAVEMAALPSPERAQMELSVQLAQGTGEIIPHKVLVAFRPGTSGAQDTMSVSSSVLRSYQANAKRTVFVSGNSLPQYTNDDVTNQRLAKLGVDHMQRLFRDIPRARLRAMESGVHLANGQATLDISNVYELHITNATVHQAVLDLMRLPTVAYAEPALRVSAMDTQRVRIPKVALQRATFQAQRMAAEPTATRVALSQAQPDLRMRSLRRITTRTVMSTSAAPASQLPTNFAITASAQSFLNAPGIDAVAAYDEIERTFHQMPGQGEIITNVSLGDLDDATAAGNLNDPCQHWVHQYGPTTSMIGNQRYLEWPGMNPIPTYTADQSGNLDGKGEVCGADPSLGEVGLDFSVMAPMPHNVAPTPAVGLFDLLGVAPGAQYRLVVPGNPQASNADLAGALLGAAMQTPNPNVITASIGFGWDQYGFPGRYLEEDPLIESVVASIIQNYHIVVCIAANDGVRTFTTAAIGPSGGSAPTNVGAPNDLTSDGDVGFSTAPSLVLDSGAIDVGATTLDDIFAAPPNAALDPAVKAEHAYPETRWDGAQDFSSGFGSRVNVSAPGDNILALSHPLGKPAGHAVLGLEGGTSASAPITAAAAAVVLQVARLTGHPITDPKAVRSLLEQTGTPVPNAPQADVPITVGPQINLRNAVESLLLKSSSEQQQPTVARVAIEQRRSAYFGMFNYDASFLTYTDPRAIDIQHGFDRSPWCSLSTGCSNPSGENFFAPITIAPDWEFIPSGAKYSLVIAGSNKVLSTTPWARLYPADILSAAGLPLKSASDQTVHLTYRATIPGANPFLPAKTISTTFSLTFSPSTGVESQIPAPQVPPVVQGTTMPVSYDLTHSAGSHPWLIVSVPGMFDPQLGARGWGPSWEAALQPDTKGTVNVPVSALQGGGVYGVEIVDEADPEGFFFRFGLSDPAFTRVVPVGTSALRPATPTLATASEPGAWHSIEFPENSQFQLSYNVSNVSKANGAIIEISAPGETANGQYFTFINVNGTERDHDIVNTGSIYYQAVSGASGTVTLSSKALGLVPAAVYNIRVLPTDSGSVVGEASDVSTLQMDGISSPDGYGVNNFGVNTHGTDGMFSSAFGDIFEFDQSTDQVSINTEIAPTNDSAYDLMGSGIFGPNDLGLLSYASDSPGIVAENQHFPTEQFDLVNPAASGALAGTWNVPASYTNQNPLSLYVPQGWTSPNDQTTTVAQLMFNHVSRDVSIFTSDIAKSAFSAPINIGPDFRDSVAYDPVLNAAIVVGSETSAPGDSSIVRVDFATQKVTPIANSCAIDDVRQAVIDDTTHIAAAICDDVNDNPQMILINLASNTTSTIPLGGFDPLFAGVDESNGKMFVALLGGGFSPAQSALFAQWRSTWDPLGLYSSTGGLSQDQNQVGAIDELSEGGTLLKVLPDLMPEGTLNWPEGSLFLQTANGMIYLRGINRAQIEPIAE